MYVRVVGNPRVFQGSKSMLAFTVRPVTDHNEISFHMLEVIAAHLYHTKVRRWTVIVIPFVRVCV